MAKKKNKKPIDEEKVDLAPTQYSEIDDAPKKFARILKIINKPADSTKLVSKSRKTMKKKGIVKIDEFSYQEKKLPAKLNKPTLRAGETYDELKLRIEDYEKRNAVLQKALKRQEEIKKANEGEEAKTEKGKPQKWQYNGFEEEIEESPTPKSNRLTNFSQLKDKVKFGDVVMEPPKKLSKPKDRFKNRRQLTQLGENKSKVEISLARKRILEEERNRVVAHYRMLKSKKLDEKNLEKEM